MHILNTCNGLKCHFKHKYQRRCDVIKHRVSFLTNYFNLSLFLFSLILLFMPNAYALEPLKESLTLNDAIKRTLNVHPDLKAYVFKSKASQAMITQSSISAPINIRAKVEDTLGTGVFSSLSAMKTTISIDWLLDNSKTQAKIKLASNKAKLVEFNKQIKALDIAAKTADIYITLLAQKEQLTLAKLGLNQASKAYNDVVKQIEVGKSLRVDKYRAKANMANKALIVEDLSHEIEASQAKLAAQWQGETNFIASGSLAEVPSVETVETSYLKLNQHPKLKKLAIEQKISNSAISLAKVNEKPAWQLSAGLKYDNFNNDFGFNAGISIPLGGENRNAGEIRKLQAEQNVKQAQTEAWQKHVLTQVLLVSHQLKHNRHVIEGLSKEVIPALESANTEAEKAYSLGRYRYSEWYDVQQDLISAQYDLISAYANVHHLNIELQRLSGNSLAL